MKRFIYIPLIALLSGCVEESEQFGTLDNIHPNPELITESRDEFPDFNQVGIVNDLDKGNVDSYPSDQDLQTQPSEDNSDPLYFQDAEDFKDLCGECGFGQYCIQGKCSYGCGDDCNPFSIIIVPDTQHYGISSNKIYHKQMKWIAENAQKENIKMVLHLGDITDGNRKSQYLLATEAHNILAEAGIPYTISTGNHDYKKGDSGISFTARNRSLFGQYFNDNYIRNHYQNSQWFHGFYNTANMYATFEVGHLKFAVIALEFFPRKDVLCWAESLISHELRDRYIIITTHGYLTNDASKYNTGHYSAGSNGDIPFGAMGADIYTELVAKHSNIIMVAGGHVSDSEHRTRTANCGNPVHEILVDYQSEKPCTSSSCSNACGAAQDAGNGWLRMMKIDPLNVRDENGNLVPNVTASTFSVLDQYQDRGELFCSSINKSKDYQYYDPAPDMPDHQYSETIDFTRPLEYRYSNAGMTAFTGRNINDIADDTTDGNQYSPKIAMNRISGDFAAAWADDADNDGITSIKARIFCAGGCSSIPQITVSNISDESLINPDIAMDRDDHIAVAWENSHGSIFAKTYQMTGDVIQNEFQLNTQTGSHPAITALSREKYIAVWETLENNPRIMMRGFDVYGQEWLPEQAVSDSDKAQTAPDIAASHDNIVITWGEHNDKTSKIMAKTLNINRLNLFSIIEVSDQNNAQNPVIDIQDNGDFYIAFEDHSRKKTRVMARGFSSDGREIQPAVELSSGEAEDPAICIAQNGTVHFTWSAPELNGGDIRKRTLKNGKLGEETAAARFIQGPQISSTIGCTQSGKSVILYADDRNQNGYTDILGRGFDQ